MPSMNRLRASLLGLGAVVIGSVTGLFGCGSSVDAVCEAKCDCEGCSDARFDECLDDLDDRGRSADSRGCLDQYDELLACQDDTGFCSGDHFETDCGPEKRDLEICMDVDDDDSCLLDADCDGGHPFCNAAGHCVECLISDDCDSGKQCSKNKCE